jgi:hypothetical protein
LSVCGRRTENGQRGDHSDHRSRRQVVKQHTAAEYTSSVSDHLHARPACGHVHFATAVGESRVERLPLEWIGSASRPGRWRQGDDRVVGGAPAGGRRRLEPAHRRRDPVDSTRHWIWRHRPGHLRTVARANRGLQLGPVGRVSHRLTIGVDIPGSACYSPIVFR